MHKHIVWSPLAGRDFANILEYLTKHNTLFYRDSKSQVDILRIYDNRQDPKTLTFLDYQ